MPIRSCIRKGDTFEPTPYRKVYRYRYDDKTRLLIDVNCNDGTWLLDIGFDVAITPRIDYKRWLMVSFDVPLFMRNDLDPRLDVIPWITCPHIGTIIEVDEHGNVIRSKGDVVYCAC